MPRPCNALKRLLEYANPRVQILGRASSWGFNPVIIYLIFKIHSLVQVFFGNISLVATYQHYLFINYLPFFQYHQLTVSDDYFENQIAMNKMLVQKNFGMLRHPFNKDM